MTGFTEYAFISIGSNLPSSAGDPRDAIHYAFDRLASLSSSPVLTSSLYVTSPVDSPAGTPDFINAVAGIIPKQDETPFSLLKKLQEIETEAGRTRGGIKNEARTLDLDLITFRDVICSEPDLTLPHPRAHERKFVLEPLMEITSRDFMLPGLSKTLGEMLAAVTGQRIEKLST